jgi:hypothetical protein
MLAETILAYSTRSNQHWNSRLQMRLQRLSLTPTTRLLLACLLCIAAGVRAADVPQKQFEFNITQGAVPVPQRTLKVEKGDAVNLAIRSDTAGELHLHGYQLSVKLSPGQHANLSFMAFATGRYPFEWHAADTRAAGSSHHRGPPLAVIEVRPK